MPESWNQFEGFTTGSCVLDRCVHAAEETAYFEATSESGNAIVRLVGGGAAESQLNLWRRIAAMSHPHLLLLREAGWVEWDGGPLAYAVLERPDENLGDVLNSRALDPGEARPALLAAAEALAYIHEQGLVHGEMGPWNIVAVGDSIKVPSDGLRPAGETANPADDVRALGLTACEMLTRRVPSFSGGKPQFAPADRAALAPFDTFISKCLDEKGRWTAARAAAYLKGAAQTEEEPAAALAQAAPEAVRRAEPVRISEPARRPEPVRMERNAGPEHAPGPDTGPSGSSVPKWLYGAAAAAVLAGVLFFGARDDKREPAATAAPAPVAAEQPKPAAPAKPSPARPAPAQPADKPAATKPAQASGAWRVIAYTYNGLGPAERKAQSINKKFPQFNAEVFAPERHRGPYLVSLNGRMTREEAVRLQRAARAKGLPRDTYIQNYTRP